MSTAAFVAVALVAGAACPLHMWLQQRRGRQAACCAPRTEDHAGLDLEALRARRQEVSARIAELETARPGSELTRG